jgi:hypothetical protein
LCSYEVFLQLKDTTERIKSVDAAAALVEEMMKQGPPPAGTIQSGGGGPPLSVVVNVGIEIDSSFNLIGRIRGPNDQYINHIMTKTGTEVAVRGIGSGYLESFSGEGMHLQSISINTYRLVVHVWIVNQGHLLP